MRSDWDWNSKRYGAPAYSELTGIFALPGISNASMKPDWMHVANEGSCALAAGQVLSELLSKCEGSTMAKRAQTLWTELKALYELRLRALTDVSIDYGCSVDAMVAVNGHTLRDSASQEPQALTMKLRACTLLATSRSMSSGRHGLRSPGSYVRLWGPRAPQRLPPARACSWISSRAGL